MAKLNIVFYNNASNDERMISVMVNGFSEMDRPVDEYLTVFSFLDSLVEMCVITNEQKQEKIKRIKKVLDIE